ncbi:zinc transport system substrate-binding protein [Bacillus mesophilus]|uniref:Zinc ABC transporter solute-binding protein n=1 Tax=Bacillus mesophilus TaxID=1808955 RepID=A0A6M0Q6V7_9BACI|nr:zinc ABC transporter substrate-binding protein [Bacillus mesophilus]MBM7660435.1 zinc transport system substrate-binding protein [Bacillus mesophilus]NEY72013.1 zinc ABC transporter solute-binding protein [Bacillus mesophilus]
MKKLSILLTLFLIISVFLMGCNEQTNNEPATETTSQETETETEITETKESALKVYTTIYPLEYFTKRIGGDHVDVTNIVPPGADGHTYEPTAKTMVDVADSNAFIYTGAGIEGYADAINEALKNEDVIIVKAADGIELIPHSENHEEHGHGEHEEEASHDEHEEEAAHDDHAHDEHEEEAGHEEHGEDAHNHGDLDPHVWLDPLLSIQLSENILHVLEELKPDAKADFEKNFNELKIELEQLDQEFKDTIANSSTKEMIVAHAAYGYWEARYGIEQISVSGLSPTNEPSQQELTKIIDTAKEHKIKYVIFEQNVSTKIAEIIKNEIKAEALTLHNLESLSEDDSSNNQDYFSLMKKNLETLKTALN